MKTLIFLLILTMIALLQWAFHGSALWMRTVGLSILALSLFTLAVASQRRYRPSHGLVRATLVVGLSCLTLWLASGILLVEIPAGTGEEWIIGNGAVAHQTSADIPPNGALRITAQPSLVGLFRPFGATETGCYGSLRVTTPTLPPAWAATGSALLLARLRRKRAPAQSCSACAYNLTGLSSDRCPECGMAVSELTPQPSL